jgi:hypothetical protein
MASKKANSNFLGLIVVAASIMLSAVAVCRIE